MKETERMEIIKIFLDMFEVNNIEDLPNEALPNLLDMITPQTNEGTWSIIYKESNKDERKQLIADIKNCLNEKCKMSLYHIYCEGIMDENTRDYFDFCSRHSVWYEKCDPLR
jgi:hypothetical protein